MNNTVSNNSSPDKYSNSSNSSMSPSSPDELESSSFLFVGRVDRMLELSNNIDLVKDIPKTPRRHLVTSPTKLYKHNDNNNNDSNDNNRGSLILTNQRRKLRGSTIILNSQRIKSMSDLTDNKNTTTTTTTTSNSNSITSSNSSMRNKLSPSTNEKIALAEEKYFRRKTAAIIIQRFWKSWSSYKSSSSSISSSIICAANAIQSWTRQLLKRRQENNYSQKGKWSKCTSDKVFALLLGYRVRTIMKSSKVKATSAAFKDIMKVLIDLVTNTNGLLDSDSSNSCTKTTDSIINAINAGTERKRFPLVLTADWVFIKSLLKQMNQQQQKIYRLIFEGSKWLAYPVPGYVCLSDAFKRLCIQCKVIPIVGQTPPRQTPPRPPPHNKNDDRAASNTFLTPPTPPSTQSQSRVSSSQRSELRTPNASSKESTPYRVTSTSPLVSESPPVRRPRPLAEAFDKELMSFDDSIKLVGANVDPQYLKASLSRVKALSIAMNQQKNEQIRSSSAAEDRPLGISRNRRSQSLDMSAKDIEVSSKPDPTSSNQRRSNKAHIQLDILSADKLMPAKRGNSSIPDRKPGLKISLYQQAQNGGNSVEMKKVHQAVRDFEETTLNPRWGSSFYLFLPSPKHILQSYIDECPDILEIIEDPIKKEEIAKRISKDLLNWWSNGYINISVIDGERFNDNVFLGEINFLLSSFLVPRKGGEDSFDVAGTFPLNKINATDKVSGSIKLHAYLHMPEDTYIFDLIGSMLSVNSSSPGSNDSTDNIKANSIQYSSPDNAENNVKKNLINVMPSPPREASNSRRSRLNDLSKCLDGLNAMQLNTDNMVKNMQLQLEQKKKNAVHDNVKILKVIKRRNIQLMEDTDIVLGTDSIEESYNSDLEFNDLD